MAKPLGTQAPSYLSQLKIGSGADYITQVAKPLYSGYLPTAEVAIGTAKKAIFGRVVIPVSGTLHDLTVFNGSTVNGKHNVAIFDTGDATAASYTPLYESGEVSATGASATQVVGDPSLAVVAGQQLLFAVMNTGTTHTYGTVGAALPAATELPTGFIPLTSGNKAKLNAKHTFSEAKFVTLTEAELESTAVPIVILGRIV